MKVKVGIISLAKHASCTFKRIGFGYSSQQHRHHLSLLYFGFCWQYVHGFPTKTKSLQTSNFEGFLLPRVIYHPPFLQTSKPGGGEGAGVAGFSLGAGVSKTLPTRESLRKGEAKRRIRNNEMKHITLNDPESRFVHILVQHTQSCVIAEGDMGRTTEIKRSQGLSVLGSPTA